MFEPGRHYLEFLKFSKTSGIPVKKILDMLFFLRDGEPVDNNLLMRETGIARNVINIIKDNLKFMLLPVSQNTQLKKQYINAVREILGSVYRPENKLLIPGSISNTPAFKYQRLKPVRGFDQFTATQETVGKRVSIMDFLADLKFKRVLFLGDDDFTSLEAAQRVKDCEISVIDIDARIVGTLSSIALKDKIKVCAYQFDIRKGLPKNYTDYFDTVFTDPPYTPEGAELFLSRAVEALNKENKAARIYFCYGSSDRAKERYLPILETVSKLGLMLRYVFNGFNSYNGAQSIGNSSSLYVAEVTPKTKALIKGNYGKKIFTNN